MVWGWFSRIKLFIVAMTISGLKASLVNVVTPLVNRYVITRYIREKFLLALSQKRKKNIWFLYKIKGDKKSHAQLTDFQLFQFESLCSNQCQPIHLVSFTRGSIKIEIHIDVDDKMKTTAFLQMLVGAIDDKIFLPDYKISSDSVEIEDANGGSHFSLCFNVVLLR